MADTGPGFFTVGGTVQAGGGLYIPRKADDQLLKLCQDGEFAYVLTPRQLGKSSLMMRTAEQLRAEAITTAIIDLTQIGVQVTAEQWYLGLLVAIEDNLLLETDIIDWWQERQQIGYTQRFTTFFEEVLLREVAGRMVILVDEIDTTLSLGFTDDFYGAIRYLYNSRSRNQELNRLSFVLIGVAMPGDLIADPQRTPFNIGRRVDLTDFTPQEAKPLAAGFNLPETEAARILGWILRWTGGHPYLTQRLCRQVSEKNRESWTAADIDDLVSETYLGEMSRLDNNLQFVRDMLTERAPDPVGVIRTYEQVWRGREVADEEQSIVKSHLKLSGVVRQEHGLLKLRNRIYATVFDDQWIAEHRPPRYWTPIIQRVALALIIVLGIAAFISGLIANSQLNAANAAREAAETARAEAEAAGTVAAYEAIQAQMARDAAVTSEAAANSARETAVASEAEANNARETAVASEAEARRQAELAAIALGSQLAAQSQVLVSSNPQQSLLLAMESVSIFNDLGSEQPSLAAQNALYQALSGSSGQGFSISNVPVTNFAANSSLLFTTHRDGGLWAWDQTDPTIQPVLLHNASTGALALNGNTPWLAAGTANGLLLWEAADIWQGHFTLQEGSRTNYESLLFSPNGEWLAAYQTSRGVYLWNLSNLAFGSLPPSPYYLGQLTVSQITFDDNGSRLAVTDSSTNETLVWNLAALPPSPSGQAEADWTLPSEAPLGGISFVAEEPLILSGNAIWNLETGQSYTYKDSTEPEQLWTSPDGQWLLLQVDGGPARLLGLAGLTAAFYEGSDYLSRGIQLGDFTPSGQAVFSDDSNWLAIGDTDGRVHYWRLEGRQAFLAGDVILTPDYTLSGLEDAVIGLAYSADGQWLIAAGEDGTVRRWQSEANAFYDVPTILPGEMNTILDIAVLPDLDLLAIAGTSGEIDSSGVLNPEAGVLELWDTADWPAEPQPIGRHSSLNEWVSDIEYSPNGRWFAAAAISTVMTRPITSTVYLWREHALQSDPFLTLEGPVSPGTQLLITPDGDYLFAADGLAPSQLLQFNYNIPDSLALDPEPALIYFWDLEADNPASTRRILTASAGYVSRLKASPDGRWLVATGYNLEPGLLTPNTTIELWNLAEPELPAVTLVAEEIEGQDNIGFVDEVIFSTDNEYLFAAYSTGEGTKQVVVWQITQDNWMAMPPQEIVTIERGPFSIALSPDSRWLAVTSPEALLLFDLAESLTEAAVSLPLTDPALYFNQTAFSEDGRRLVISGPDTDQILLLDFAAPDFRRSGIILRFVQISGAGALTAAFSPENDFLVTPLTSGFTLLWPLDTAQLNALACRTAGRNLRQSEWEQYLFNPDYEVTCPDYPPDATAVPSLLQQAQRLVDEEQIAGAQIVYSQVISAVVRSLDTQLAVDVCATTAELSDETLIETLLPACEWASELVQLQTDGTGIATYNACAAGQAHPETAAAVEPACALVVDRSLQNSLLQEAGSICIQGTESGSDLAVLVAPICAGVIEALPEAAVAADVYEVCRDATEANLNSIVGPACNRVVEIVSESSIPLDQCFTANSDNLGQIAADICQAGFMPYIESEDPFSLIDSCLDAGEIEVEDGVVHACGLMAAAVQASGSDDLNYEVCLIGLQELVSASPAPDDFAELILPVCQTAVALEPENGRYYSGYGVALALTGDTDAALEALDFYRQWATVTENETDLFVADELINQLEDGQTPDPFLLNEPLFQQEQSTSQ